MTTNKIFILLLSALSILLTLFMLWHHEPPQPTHMEIVKIEEIMTEPFHWETKEIEVIETIKIPKKSTSSLLSKALPLGEYIIREKKEIDYFPVVILSGAILFNLVLIIVWKLTERTG